MSHPKIASADHEIHDLIQQRWSPRAFDESREVARGELLRLFEAARWAPSSGNEQPWAFVVLDRAHDRDAHATLLATLTERNQAWANAAPVLVLVAVRLASDDDNRPAPAPWYDAGQAVAFLTLQATAQDLSIRQMAGFDRSRAREVCGVPASFEPAVVMAIGYAGDPETLALDRHRQAERQPRARRPMQEFVFERQWGQGIS
jgi:nitroreductase